MFFSPSSDGIPSGSMLISSFPFAPPLNCFSTLPSIFMLYNSAGTVAEARLLLTCYQVVVPWALLPLKWVPMSIISFLFICNNIKYIFFRINIDIFFIQISSWHIRRKSMLFFTQMELRGTQRCCHAVVCFGVLALSSHNLWQRLKYLLPSCLENLRKYYFWLHPIWR